MTDKQYLKRLENTLADDKNINDMSELETIAQLMRYKKTKQGGISGKTNA